MNTAVTILLSVLGGGSFLTFLQFLISRKDNSVVNSLQKLDNKIDALESRFIQSFNDLHREIQDVSAENARIRILQFSEQSRKGYTQSKEAFDQAHEDIDRLNEHNKLYDEEPDSRTKAAILNIERLYQEALKLEAEGRQGFLS